MTASDWNRRVIQAMQRAQAALGIRSGAAFARRLASRTGGSPDASTYQRWLRGDSAIPAWALVLAAEEAQESVDTLLGGEPASPDRLSRIETTLNALQAQMTEVRQRLGLAPLGDAQAAHDGRPTVATAIITHHNRVLMTRRRFKEGSLVWGFVTGECEPGETPEQAAIREVEEEVGLTVAVEQRLGERIHPASGRHMIYFACRVIAGEARLIDREELAEVAWCTLDEAAERAAPTGGIYAPVQEYLERVLT